MKNNKPLCGKFYGLSPSPEQARPYAEASERKVETSDFLELKSVHFILAQSGTSIEFRPLSF